MGSRGKGMDELSRAYLVLGVNPSMSIEEIDDIYEELIREYSTKAKENMYYQKKIEEWQEAYEIILEYRISNDQEEFLSPISIKESLKEFKLAKFVIAALLIVLSVVIVNQISDSWNSEPVTTSTSPFEKGSYSSALYDLANGFTLNLGKFNSTADWDWGYFENGQSWTIVVAIEVVESHDLGAFINVYNFRLDEDHPTTYISEDIYLDPDLNVIHYLGSFSELVPANGKFGVVFQVPSFQSGEERIIYYQHPDGMIQTVGQLSFKTSEMEVEDKGIFVDLNLNIYE